MQQTHRREPVAPRHRRRLAAALASGLLLGRSAFVGGTARSWAAAGPRSQRGGDTLHALERPGEQEVESMLEEAARLKGEAEAAAALLAAQKNLRETRERVEQAAAKPEEPEDIAKEAARVAEQLEVAQTKLRKAEAFALPERHELRQEVEGLERRAEELKAQLSGTSDSGTSGGPVPQEISPLEPVDRPSQPLLDVLQQAGLKRNGKPVSEWTDADWEVLAAASENMSVEQRFNLAQAIGSDGRRRLSEISERNEAQQRKKEEEANAQEEEKLRAAARGLREKLSFEKLKEMSNEERVAVAQEVGPAYVASLVIVAQAYWALNIPFLLAAYHETTGRWPDLGSLGELGSVQAAGAFAGVFAIYALMKPVRLFAALVLTPWTLENVMPKLPRFGPFGGEGKQ